MELNCRGSVVKFLSHLAKCAPENLKREEPQFDFARLYVWLGEDLAVDLFSTLGKIRLELVPNHAEDLNVLNAFWDELVCEVGENARKYLEFPQKLDNLVDKFGETWKQPLSEFNVIYAIENLALGTSSITLLGVEFFASNDAALTARAIDRREIERWGKEKGTISLARARVEAAQSASMFDSGRNKVIRAVDLMRVAALRGSASNMQFDEFLQWKLTGHYIAMPVDELKQPQWPSGFHRPFSPLVHDISESIRRGITELGVEEYSNLPQDTRDRILRSIYWISHSSIHEVDDHKLVDLCTAMEVLLIPEERGVSSKGTTIALRYHLLMGNMIDTSVKWLYDRRNEVVHGGPLPVVGPREVWELRLICFKIIRSLVHLSIKKPDARTLRDLVNTLETRDRIKHFIHISKYAEKDNRMLPKIVEAAQKKLKRLDSKNK